MAETFLLCLLSLFLLTTGSSALICHSCEAKENSQCTGVRTCQVFHNDPESSEVCQNNYRIVDNQVMIRKACKQKKACEVELGNADNNCDEHGGRNTVCRCCCDTDRCNSGLLGCVYPTDCKKPESPIFGRRDCPERFKVGMTCKFYCDHGYKPVGPESTKCVRGENGTLVNYPPEIPVCEKQIVRCKPPHKDPENGKAKCSNTKEFQDKTEYNYEGSICKFLCDKNYAISGEKSSKCQSNGKWSTKAPTCVRGKCKPFAKDPKRIDKYSDRYWVGSQCRFKCKRGYRLFGPEISICQQDRSEATAGIWSKPPPKCKKIVCQPIHERPSHGSVTCTDKNNLNSVCTFLCDPGYDIDDTEENTKEIICEDDGGKDSLGEWSGTAATCTPITCQPRLVDPKNGLVECTKKNLLGSVCTYICNDGYDLDGTVETIVETICEDDGDGDAVGEWSEPPATCTIIKCDPEYDFVENGEVTCTKGNRKGSVCTFTCDDLYDLDDTKSDSRTTRCVDDGDGDSEGVWKGSVGSCTIIKCIPPHTDPGNGTVSCSNENILQSECEFECNYEYDLVGKPISKCEDRKKDGDSVAEWSSKAPFCKIRQCELPKIDETNIVRKCGTGEGVEQIKVGTICTYRCAEEGHYMTPSHNNKEFILEGKLDAECQIDKTWKEKPPKCFPVVCIPVLTAPDNGFMPRCTNANKYRSVCKFECKSTYKRSHDNDVICESDGDNDQYGKWSEDPPKCLKNECEDWGQVKFGVMKFTNGNQIGSVGNLTCNERYTPKKYESINCLPADARKTVPYWDRTKYVCCVRCSFNPFIKVVFVADKTVGQRDLQWKKVSDFVEIVLFSLNNKGYILDIGFVLYDMEVDTKLSLPLEKVKIWEDIDAFTNKIRSMPFGGSASNTGEALEYTHSEMFSKPTTSEPYIILIPGPKSRDSVADVSQAIRNKDINILAVDLGTGSALGKAEMKVITGEEKNVFSIMSYPKLQLIPERITTISIANGCSQAGRTQDCPK